MPVRVPLAVLAAAIACGALVGCAAEPATVAGADLEARGDQGRTPLVVATKSNQIDVALALLDAGADPNAADDIADSAFLYAGAEGFNEILTATVEHGADVASLHRFGGTALIPASEHAHVDTVRILIDAGAAIDHVNNSNWTALHEAIILGDGSDRYVTVAGMLLEAGADPSIADGSGVLPRQLAAERGYDGIVARIDRAS